MENADDEENERFLLSCNETNITSASSEGKGQLPSKECPLL